MRAAACSKSSTCSPSALTHPAALLAAEAPVGPANDPTIAAALERAALVVAWGTIRRRLTWRVGEVRTKLRSALPNDGPPGPFCLGVTAMGAPRHPLFVKRDQSAACAVSFTEESFPEAKSER